MVYAIIVYFHSGIQRLWFGKGAPSPACWHQAGWGAPFLCGDGSPARAALSQIPRLGIRARLMPGALHRLLAVLCAADCCPHASQYRPQRAPP